MPPKVLPVFVAAVAEHRRRRGAAHAPGACQGTGVSLATDKASHLTPWRGKFTCARASSPLPSSAVTVPSPNLVWNTCIPERRPCEGAAFCGGTGGLAKESLLKPPAPPRVVA